MNHTEAVNMQAADRYLLGELSESESSDFEEHYFVCAECAAELESGAILVENTRAALEEMRRGLKMAVRDGAGEAGAHAQLRMSRVGGGLVGATNMTRVSPLSPRHDRDRQGGVATA